ncbi:MAG: hypothetical protein V1905_02300 [bacterium]
MKTVFYYGFVLGRNPAIGATEIYVRLKNTIVELALVSPRLIVLGLSEELANPAQAINRLYGTVKIVELPNGMVPNSDYRGLKIDVALFLRLIPKQIHRITFGFSIYNIDAPQPRYDEIRKNLIPLAYKLKKELKIAGYNANFLGLKVGEVTTNTINDKQMIGKGVDFAVIIINGNIIIGKTVAIQNTEDYERRNYHRPFRNLRSGTMPIKLARSMIALAEAPLDSMVVDPFCGSGTIITELILMGFTNIVGSDNDPNAIKETGANIQWLFDNYPEIREKQILLKVGINDAVLVSDQFKTKNIRAIISEPYLGPIFKTNPSKETVNQLFVYLADLYLRFFKSANKCLKTDAKIVFIFPVIPVNNQFMYLDILDDIEIAGFKPVMPLPLEWCESYPYEITNRNSFLVKKEGQILIRELFVFEKTGELSH